MFVYSINMQLELYLFHITDYLWTEYNLFPHNRFIHRQVSHWNPGQCFPQVNDVWLFTPAILQQNVLFLSPVSLWKTGKCKYMQTSFHHGLEIIWRFAMV